jgi:hypothetical protein
VNGAGLGSSGSRHHHGLAYPGDLPELRSSDRAYRPRDHGAGPAAPASVPAPASAPAPAPARPGIRRWAALGAVLAVLTAAAAVGDAGAAVLLDRQPLVLLALTPRTTYQVAAAHDVPFVAFVAVSVARLCAADPFHFHLGRTAGPAVVAAAGRHPLAGRLCARVAAGAARLPAPGHWLWPVAICVSPTAKTMVVAGARAVRPLRVAVANVAGTAARVLAVWHAGHAFPQVADACRTVAPVLAAPGLAAAAALVWSRQSRRRAAADA